MSQNKLSDAYLILFRFALSLHKMAALRKKKMSKLFFLRSACTIFALYNALVALIGIINKTKHIENVNR